MTLYCVAISLRSKTPCLLSSARFKVAPLQNYNAHHMQLIKALISSDSRLHRIRNIGVVSVSEPGCSTISVDGTPIPAHKVSQGLEHANAVS